MGSLDLESALASCRYYPVQVDLDRRLVWFAEIEREVYSRAGFLVPKHAAMSDERYGFNLDDVLLYDLSLPIGGALSHYIFISAFCCSTLLARLLDRVPDCLVLKEPSVLGQLAMLRYRPGTMEENTDREKEWKIWGELGIRLLTRTFESGETVIVKAADVCNTMGDMILANDPRSKGVLLSVGLRTFILSVLKLENRRVWTRKRANFWHKTLTLFPALNEVDISDLDDGQKAAYIWFVTAALWNRLRKQTESERLLLMDGEEVSENPESALRMVARFFGLPLAESQVEEILADPVLSHHAKFPGKTYDAALRRKDRADWEARFGADADRAMEWSASIQKRLETDGIDLTSMADAEHEELVL